MVKYILLETDQQIGQVIQASDEIGAKKKFDELLIDWYEVTNHSIATNGEQLWVVDDDIEDVDLDHCDGSDLPGYLIYAPKEIHRLAPECNKMDPEYHNWEDVSVTVGIHGGNVYKDKCTKCGLWRIMHAQYPHPSNGGETYSMIHYQE